MRTRRLLSATVLFLAGVSIARAQPAFEPLDPVQRGATTVTANLALTTFLPSLIDAANFDQLGFQSQAEVPSAVAGEPIREMRVRLDRLAQGVPGQPASQFVEIAPLVMVPVLVDEDGAGPEEPKARSAIGLAPSGAGWRVVSFGDAPLAQAIQRERSQIVARGIPVQTVSLVTVPAFNLFFVSYRGTGGKLMLAPLFNERHFQFQIGVETTADSAFQLLKPAAQSHNGDPT